MDFIKCKIIYRSILSSIAPIFIYSVGFAISRIFVKDGDINFEYGNRYAWLTILALAIVYPINQISLWFLFKPIELFLDKKLKVDSSQNPILKGNFAPIHNEQSYEMIDIIDGKIPTDINGVYLRNGPNPKFIPSNGRHHWFDGDSMIHAIRIKNGQLFYCNRQTQTPKYQQELKAGKALKMRAGEIQAPSGLFKVLLLMIQDKIGYTESLHKYKSGVANTAFTHHSNMTYALLEADYPFHIKVDQNEKSFDILSIGHDDFNGQLTHNVSAHPKVDQKTGEMMAFGYDIEQAFIHYSLIDKNRQVVSKMEIPITSGRMIHDFAVMEKYCIIPDLPMEFRPDLVMENKFIFQFDEAKPARYGIMKRNNTRLDDIQWFILPNHYVFHFVNAWEFQNEKGEEMIRLFGCSQTHVDIDLDKGEHPFAAGAQAPQLSKFEFNLSTGEATWKVMEDTNMEFPVIEQSLIGYQSKYAYLACFKSVVPESQVGKDNCFFEAVIKYDLEKEIILNRIDFGETKSAGEVFFHKRDNASSEDDGYLMSFVFDYETNKSEFIMWDAKTMDSKPVVRAQTQERVPNGFHTFFVHETDLEK